MIKAVLLFRAVMAFELAAFAGMLAELDVPATILAVASLVTAVGGLIAVIKVSRQVGEVKKDVNSNFTNLEKKFDASQLVVTDLQNEIKTLQADRLQDAKDQIPMVPATAAAQHAAGPLPVTIVPSDEPLPVTETAPKAKGA